MPRVTVVDVGDGACTVLRCACTGQGCECGVAVVDCGTWRARPAHATDRLVRVLGSDGLRRLDTLVVTHFDADHWEGLRLLADNLRQPRRSTLHLHYPCLPESAPNVAGASLAMVAALRFSGVRPLELATALETVATVVLRPMTRGEEFTAAGGGIWKVMWPPEQLPSGLSRRLDRAVRDTERLADLLDTAGYPALRANLEEAYARPFPGGDQTRGSGETSDYSNWSANLPAALRQGDWQRSEAWLVGPTMGQFTNGVHGFDEVSVDAIPPEYRRSFIKVSRALAAANNDLSLVFHDTCGSLAVFGDAGRAALKSAIEGMQERYRVVLAPHHGTYSLPEGFPKAELCVAQAGDHHVTRWDRHLTAHGQPRSCVSTQLVGTISVW